MKLSALAPIRPLARAAAALAPATPGEALQRRLAPLVHAACRRALDGPATPAVPLATASAAAPASASYRARLENAVLAAAAAMAAAIEGSLLGEARGAAGAVVRAAVGSSSLMPPSSPQASEALADEDLERVAALATSLALGAWGVEPTAPGPLPL